MIRSECRWKKFGLQSYNSDCSLALRNVGEIIELWLGLKCHVVMRPVSVDGSPRTPAGIAARVLRPQFAGGRGRGAHMMANHNNKHYLEPYSIQPYKLQYRLSLADNQDKMYGTLDQEP